MARRWLVLILIHACISCAGLPSLRNDTAGEVADCAGDKEDGIGSTGIHGRRLRTAMTMTQRGAEGGDDDGIPGRLARARQCRYVERVLDCAHLLIHPALPFAGHARRFSLQGYLQKTEAGDAYRLHAVRLHMESALRQRARINEQGHDNTVIASGRLNENGELITDQLTIQTGQSGDRPGDADREPKKGRGHETPADVLTRPANGLHDTPSDRPGNSGSGVDSGALGDSAGDVSSDAAFQDTAGATRGAGH